MKNLRPFLIVLLSLLAAGIFAQPACTVKYQAVARDADDNVYPNREIGVQFSVLPGPVYVERHTTTTTSLGHFYLELGGGDPQLGNFTEIDWAATEYSLQIEVDLDGGTNYEVLGESPILAVPVALWAKNTNFAFIADSVIRKPQLNLTTVVGDCGNEMHLDYCGNITVIPDTDPNNELINEIILNGNILEIYEGFKNDKYTVDLSSLTGDGGDSKWICQGDSLIYMPNDSVKIVIDGEGDLSIDSGPDNVLIGPTGIIFDDGGGFYYDSESNETTLIAAKGEIDTLMANKIFSNYICIDSMDVGGKDDSVRILIGPNDIVFNNGNGLFSSNDGEKLYGYFDWIYADTLSVDKVFAFDICTDTLKIIDSKGATNAAYQKYYQSIDDQYKIISEYKDLNDNEKYQKIYNVATDAYWVEYYNKLNQPVLTISANNSGGEVLIKNGTGDKTLFKAGSMESNPDVGIAKSDVILADTLKGEVLCVDSIKVDNNLCAIDDFKNHWTLIEDLPGFPSLQYRSSTGTNVTIDPFGIISIKNPEQFGGTSIGGFGVSVGIDGDGIYYDRPNNATSFVIDTIKSGIICTDSLKIGDAIITMSNIPGDENYGHLKMGTTEVPEALSLFTRPDKNMANNIFSTGFGQAWLFGPTPQSTNIDGGFYDPVSETNIITIDQLFKGVSNFSIPNPKNEDERIVYACIEGPEAAAYERGVGQLVNGEAVIEFSSHFRDIIDFESMTIQLTPGHWDTYGLAVIEKTSTGFKVKELKGGEGNFSFDWEVKAVRAGYENYRVIRSKDDYMFQTTDDLEKARKLGRLD